MQKCDEEGAAMKNSPFAIRLIFSFFLLSLYFACITPAESTSSEDPADNYSYADIVSGKMGFLYRDDMLLQSGLDFSSDLAKASVVLAAKAYDQSALWDILSSSDKYTGEDTAHTDMHMGMGYTILDDRGSYSAPRTLTDNDKVAYTIATKRVGDYLVYCIPIRGTEGAEWFSDFYLRDDYTEDYGGRHKGFYLAADQVYSDIFSCFASDGCDAAHRIVWLTGHSRGAAVANILACRINEMGLTSPDHLFCYTFACPAFTQSPADWGNIYNFNNAGDIIPTLPLSDWEDGSGKAIGYYRSGNTIVQNLDGNANFARLFETVTNGKSLTLFNSTSDFEQAMRLFVPTEKDYFDPDRQLIIAFLALDLSTKSGNTDITAADLIEFMNQKRSEPLLKALVSALADCTGFGTLYLVLDETSQDLESLSSTISAAITYLSDPDHSGAEVNDYDSSLMEKIWSMVGYYISPTISGLRDALREVQKGITQARNLCSIIPILANMLCDTDGNLLDAVDCGHQPETYYAWITSEYFGYQGWNGADASLVDRDRLANTTTIGQECFMNSTGLGSVSFSGNLKGVGRGTFQSAGLSGTLLLSEGTEWIGDAAFADNAFENLFIPCSVKFLGQDAFREQVASMREVTLPVELSVSGIFSNTSAVERIYYLKGSTGIMADRHDTTYGDPIPQGCTDWYGTLEYNCAESLQAVYFEEGITHIGDMAFEPYNVSGVLESVFFPSTLESIGDNAFYLQKQLTGDLELPETVQELGEYSFAETGITSAVLPEGIETVPAGCFFECADLTHVDLPESLKSIGNHAFCETGLIQLTLPHGFESFGEYSFTDCHNLKEVTMPVELTPGSAFFNAAENLETLHYLKGSTGIMPDFSEGDTLGKRQSLKKVIFEEGLVRIGDNAFDHSLPGDSLLKEVELPSTLESIGRQAFSGCSSLTSLALPGGLAEIESGAFSNTGLHEMTIPASVVRMGDRVFGYSDDLAKVVFLGDAPQRISETDSDGNENFRSTFTGDALKVIYPSAGSGWTQDLMDEMGDYAFAVIWLADDTPVLKLPASLTEIGEEAFSGISARIIEIPDGAVRIGARAFADMPSKVLIIIPASVTEIDETAFPIETGTQYFIEAPDGSAASEFAGARGGSKITPWLPSTD